MPAVNEGHGATPDEPVGVEDSSMIADPSVSMTASMCSVTPYDYLVQLRSTLM